MHLFEFSDQPWVPSLVRRMIVESLSDAIRWGDLLRGVLTPLDACLERAGTGRILELCSGAGAASERFVAELSQRRQDVHLVLTDLEPRVERWAGLKDRWPRHIDFADRPVDALRLPPELVADRVVLIVNGLHHFAPLRARSLLRLACRSGARGVMVVEGLVRNPMSFLAMSPLVLAAMLSNPVRASREHLARLLSVPLGVLAGAWDGVISSLRTYPSTELHGMVSDVKGWRWDTGTFRFAAGLGKGSWFAGVAG